MRMIFGLVLVVGIALAGAAIYMTRGFFEGSQNALAAAEQQLRQIGPLAKVFVVTKDVKYGEPITRDDVQQILWQQAVAPKGAFTEIDTLFPPGEAKERYVLRQMEQYEPITLAKVSAPGQPSTLTTKLGRGIRAFAISVNATSGVSGFVQPGDHVDVYWTGSSGTGVGEMTRLIESSINVIAVDQTADSERGGAMVARTVTVAASPEQVARLAQAQATGALALSLVGSADDAVTDRVEIDNKRLLGIEEQQIVEAPREQVCTIRTRKGSEIVETPIPCTN